MREIKFRVWDVLNKRMLDWGRIFDLPAWEIFPGTPEQRPFNVMQYTGLKDRNGKEIYEGDVVKGFKKTYEDTPTINKVKFIKGCWRLVAGTVNDVPLHNYNESELEVIGNIYDNPELLGEVRE